AVDESKGSLRVIDTFMDIFSCMRPEEVILLYVEKLGGGPMMDEMLGGPEMATMKEALKGTDYQIILDKKAEKVLNYYRAAFDKNEVAGIRTVVSEGHPADEIIETAKKEGVGMILLGSRGKRKNISLMGSVSREVANMSDISVLIAK
ncbi:MAG TPA: universal stress protein, partial [Nitrospirae bacterium]|nr:universal stress protein [Nitrospirota bacterium]